MAEAARKKRKAEELAAKNVQNEQTKFRRTLDGAGRDTMDALREQSRRVYVANRVEKVLDLTRTIYNEEQRAKPLHKLSQSELMEREKEKRILELADEYQKLADEPDEHYHMPDAYLDEQKGRLDRAKKASALFPPPPLPGRPWHCFGPKNVESQAPSAGVNLQTNKRRVVSWCRSGLSFVRVLGG